MRTRQLGRTGLLVSELGFGTVSLGVDYGIRKPGDFGAPPEAESLAALREAADAGVRFFDTAPAYGEAERLVGLALGDRRECVVATKVLVPEGLPARDARRHVRESLDQSRAVLRRDAIDVAQIHNATAASLAEGTVTQALIEAQDDGLVRHLGASVYGEDAALAVVRAGVFDVLQVAYSVLDQRMAARVLPAAREAGVGVIARSALLKGALTSKGRHLPDKLAAVRAAAERAREALGATWDDLPEAAVRYCLSSPDVACTLVGARTVAELKAALAAAAAGPLPPAALERAAAVAVDDDALVNPARWPVP